MQSKRASEIPIPTIRRRNNEKWILSHTIDINQSRSEEGFGSHKSFATKANDTTIRKFVVGDENGGLVGQLVLKFEIVTNLEVRRGEGEGIDGWEVRSKVSP